MDFYEPTRGCLNDFCGFVEAPNVNLEDFIAVWGFLMGFFEVPNLEF